MMKKIICCKIKHFFWNINICYYEINGNFAIILDFTIFSTEIS